LGGEPHVLAAPTDRQGELALGDHNLDAVRILIQHHFGHFGRRQRIDDEGGSILVPLDDVDLLALQLADHRLHTLTAHADAGADRIDRGVLGNDGNFCPGAGISRHRLDLHDAIVDLRDLRPEQQRHEFGTSTGEKDLGPTLLAAHIIDVGPDAVAEPDVFAWNHLVAPDDPLRLLQIDDDVAIFDALDGTANDFADAILELAVLALAFRIAHLLHDHLLGILGGHPAEIRRWQWLSDQIADLGVGIASLGGRQHDLRGVVFYRLDHLQHARKFGLARLWVDHAANVVLGAIAGLGRLLDRVLHGLDDDLAINRLLARDRIGDLHQLQTVSANSGLGHL